MNSSTGESCLQQIDTSFGIQYQPTKCRGTGALSVQRVMSLNRTTVCCQSSNIDKASLNTSLIISKKYTCSRKTYNSEQLNADYKSFSDGTLFIINILNVWTNHAYCFFFLNGDTSIFVAIIQSFISESISRTFNHLLRYVAFTRIIYDSEANSQSTIISCCYILMGMVDLSDNILLCFHDC